VRLLAPAAERAVAITLLVLVLAASPLLGLITPYLVALICIGVWLATLLQGRLAAAYADLPSRLLLGVFVVLGVLFAVTADAPSDALRVFNFIMLLLFGPVALLLAQRAGPDSAQRVAALAAIGVALGLLSILWDLLVNGESRPRGFNIGPIVLSNALLAIAFLALGAALVYRGRRSWLYAAVPLAAILATLLTGSRGPLLAVPPLLLLSLVWFWRARFRGSPRIALWALGALAVAAVLGFLLVQGRAATMLTILQQLAAGTAVVDETTRIRFALYEAGWQAFLQSPWIGHGWANLMEAATVHLRPEDVVFARYPQLHNDFLNFAVAGGVVGVVCYLLILATPLVGALVSPRDSLRTFRLYGASVLVVTYFFAGLTDLMFGFEFHTMLFVMLTAILLGYCRERPPAPA
jgi:O-antigen ligase